ncbi:MAG: hypothetical protein FWB87_13780 [Defluviitaleaceae bacterium]|nr:hypothetical protein [Defluviitaleaceae bacterium]
MDAKITIYFKGGKQLAIGEYTTLNISRTGTRTDINITNEKNNLAFDELFNQMLKHMKDDATIKVKVALEAGEVTYTDMTAEYFLTTQGEILHLGTAPPQAEEPNQGEEK